MSRPAVIVTGPIGSGKSAVCALLRSRGIPVYDCDRRAKELYRRRPAMTAALEERLGIRLLLPDGRLDRAGLAGLIFRDPSAREQLEALVYPELLKDFKRWKSRQKGAPFVVLESAVILSKPVFAGVARFVLSVEAPEEVRLRRVLARDGGTEAEARRRMQAQEIPPASAVDVRIVNEGTPEELYRAVSRVFFDKNSYLCRIIKHEE